MIYFLEGENPFPPVDYANIDGLLCFGGELSPDRLIQAYSQGIFPWADDPVLWFSPDPRMIVDLPSWKPSKSLKRTFAKKNFKLTINQHFPEVIKKCGAIREDTWISNEFIKSYSTLHSQGVAHSFEVHQDEKLVGGLYGVSLGKAFFGESMFFEVSDASKVAYMHLIHFLKANQFELLDCQINNPHLVRMGGIDISRKEYIERLKKALKNKNLNWDMIAKEYCQSLTS
jgi:leucyl/phenylalanyl-tRNA---protein transferase